jgi:glycosyltransferase involved in cell wall biosynthesis
VGAPRHTLTTFRHSVKNHPVVSTGTPADAAHHVEVPPGPGTDVSVVIPCHGHADYVAEAVASVSRAHVASETIVVDDGSPGDGVRSVLRDWPAVRLIEQPRLGVSIARNRGLEACRGRFVLFLDADDRLLPGALEASVECFERHPSAGFVHGRYRFIRLDGAPAGQPSAPWPATCTYLDLVRSNYVGMLATVLFRTDVVRSLGGFRPGLAFSEDYELMLRTARNHPIARHEAVMAEYRRYSTSVSADASRMLAAVLRVLDEEQREAPDDAATRAAFDEGRRSFKLFYGVRLVRQIFREGLLRGRLGATVGWTRQLLRLLGPRLTFVTLPPSVAVAAVRKCRWIARGWWEQRTQKAVR